MRATSSLGLLVGLLSAGAGISHAGNNWCDFVETIDKPENLAKISDVHALNQAGLTITAKYVEGAKAKSEPVTGQGLKDFLKTSIQSEMDSIVAGPSRSNYEDKALISSSQTGEAAPMTDGPVAIIILGPSAVGKSHLTRTKIQQVLEANGIVGKVPFVAIDGGILREDTVLPTWDEIKSLAAHVGCMGFSDAYEKKDGKTEVGIAKNAMSKGKTALQKIYLEAKQNVIVPTTASDMAKETTAITGFADAGYRVIFMAVNADQANAAVMGCSRARGEGKKYSGSSWLKSVKNAAELISQAHSDASTFGAFAKTATHFVFDNNNYPVLKERGGDIRESQNPNGLQIPSGSTLSVGCLPNEADFKGLKEAPAAGPAREKLLKCDYVAAGASASGAARFKATLTKNRAGGAETSSSTDQRRRAFRSFGALPGRELEQRPEIKREVKRSSERSSERRLVRHLEATRRRKEIEALRLFPELEGVSPDEYTIDVDSSTCASQKQRMVGVHAMAAACGGGIIAGGLFLAVGDDSGETSHRSGGPLGPILLLVFGALIVVDSARRLVRDHHMGRCPWQEVVTRRGAYEHFSEVPQGGKELADLIESEHAKAWNINRMARKLPRVADIVSDVGKKKKKGNGKALSRDGIDYSSSSSSGSSGDEYLCTGGETKGGSSPLRPKGLPSLREGLSFADFKKKRLNHRIHGFWW
eukprot:g3951.t1